MITVRLIDGKPRPGVAACSPYVQERLRTFDKPNNHVAGLGCDPSGSDTRTTGKLNDNYYAEQWLLQVGGATTCLYDPDGGWRAGERGHSGAVPVRAGRTLTPGRMRS